MSLAIAEARKGQGRTSPNPCVGAVIVKNGIVISKGYHKKAGTPHAEVHALEAAGENAAGATLYVTLEPCCHIGKTPPCSHAVVGSGIRRVVIGMLDPNPLVDGGGRQYLLQHGVEVVSGVREGECRDLNKPFLKYIQTGRSYITLKAAISLDGHLSYQKGAGGRITGPESLAVVHALRNIYDAILVGRATIENDNPSLTTRLNDGNGRDATRIVLDTFLQTSPDSRVYHLQSNVPTLVFCSNELFKDKICTFQDATHHTEVVPVSCNISGSVDLTCVCRELCDRGIISILVEGGGTVHAAFLRSGLADSAALFYAPIFAGSEGAPFIAELTVSSREDAISLTDVKHTSLGADILIEGDIQYPLLSRVE